MNDAGNQIEKFATSLEVRYLQHYDPAVELPEDWAHQLPPQRVQEKKPRKTAIETDVIPPQTTLPEDEEDYRPLDEVLEELRGK